MASKFQQFLTDNKIDPRRLLVASTQLERLRPEDRAARLAKRRGKKAETPAAEEKGATPKGHSGKPVTPRLLSQALAGGAISGAQKTRLARAVNRVLEQKKKDPADLRAMF